VSWCPPGLVACVVEWCAGVTGGQDVQYRVLRLVCWLLCRDTHLLCAPITPCVCVCLLVLEHGCYAGSHICQLFCVPGTVCDFADTAGHETRRYALRTLCVGSLNCRQAMAASGWRCS
jgi:hypothetical protein